MPDNIKLPVKNLSIKNKFTGDSQLYKIIMEPATTDSVGAVKPDGTSIVIDPDGTLHSTGGVSGVLPITSGGTGNDQGLIQSGQKENETLGDRATAEGEENIAAGDNSHVNGSYNTAGYDNQTVVGIANNNKSTTLFEVGNGVANGQHKNAFEVYDNGAISTDDGTTKIRFGQDGNGNYGYIKDGADTVIPFKNPTGNIDAGTYTTNGAKSINVEDYATASFTIDVPSSTLQTKTTNVTPGANQSEASTTPSTILPDTGYDGMSSVEFTVPMLRDGTLMTAGAVASPGTVYNGDTAQSNSQQLLRIAPTKDGMSYTGSYLYVKPNSYLGNASAEDVVAGKTFSSSNGIQITGTGSGGGTANIYGVSQPQGSNSGILTRTDSAYGKTFQPTTSSTRNPRSFFDGVMPQAGIRELYESPYGMLIEIPKFQYKYTVTSTKITLQIADKATSGYYVSPAHADRGDGIGERDYVYVWKYKCKNNYKSESNSTVLVNVSKAGFRSSIHSLNNTAQMMDYAMISTIRMLYLVETARWDSKRYIGGNGSGGTQQVTGTGDYINYHTGTPASSASTYSNGIKYRGIEDLQTNYQEYIDGISTKNRYWYVGNNPRDYINDMSSITSAATNVQASATGTSSAAAVTKQTLAKNYVLVPTTIASANGCYVIQYSNDNLTVGHPMIGGDAAANEYYGIQAHQCYDGDANGITTARGMVLPATRLIGS